MKQSIITNSFDETQKLGSDLVQKLGDKRVIGLYGELGSGKTTFVQGLAKGLGITNKIISPTFIIMRSYSVPLSIRNSPFSNFYHVDLYRINSSLDMQDIGITELMTDTKNLFAIEWPEKLGNLLPKNRLDIYFEYIDDNKRKITF